MRPDFTYADILTVIKCSSVEQEVMIETGTLLAAAERGDDLFVRVGVLNLASERFAHTEIVFDLARRPRAGKGIRLIEEAIRDIFPPHRRELVRFKNMQLAV